MDKLMWMDIGIVKAVICGVFLLVEGIRDLRRREISVISCAVVILSGILLQLWKQDLSLFGILSGVLMGGGMFLLSFLSRESIGYGDGLVMLAIGILLGGQDTAKLFCGALFLCGIVSGVLFLCRKVKRKSRIPFVVFLFPTYGFLFFMEVCLK